MKRVLSFEEVATRKNAMKLYHPCFFCLAEDSQLIIPTPAVPCTMCGPESAAHTFADHLPGVKWRSCEECLAHEHAEDRHKAFADYIAFVMKLEGEGRSFTDWIDKEDLELRATRTSSVYFILDAPSRAIKIGWADHPPHRLNELQPGNPHELRIIGTIPGGASREGKLHRRFAHLRIRGEWFRADSELMAFIRENACDDTASGE